MTRSLRIAVRVALIAMIAVLFWYFIRQIAWDELATTLRHARIWPLIPAVAIAFFMLWCAAYSLGVMLAPRFVVSTPRLFRYTIVAYAGSVINDPDSCSNPDPAGARCSRLGIPACKTAGTCSVLWDRCARRDRRQESRERLPR